MARACVRRRWLAWSLAVMAMVAPTATALPARAEAETPPLAAPPPAPKPDAPIATPAAGASPQNVQQAQNKANAAALTPLVPSPQNPLRPAFQLYAEIDLPVLGIGAVFALARFVRVQKAFCAPLCDRNDLNALDRTTAGYWSPGWQTASDVGLAFVGVGATALLMTDEGWLPGLNDTAVVAESALAGVAVASLMTEALGRPRPFLYGEKAPLSARNGPDAGLSFLSSHAAASFAIATSTAVAMHRLHPHSKAPWYVLAAGGALATFVSAARVLGGMHFITDSVGGAVVGTSLGVLIPAMHKSPVAVVPVVSMSDPGGRGAALPAGLGIEARF